MIPCVERYGYTGRSCPPDSIGISPDCKCFGDKTFVHFRWGCFEANIFAFGIPKCPDREQKFSQMWNIDWCESTDNFNWIALNLNDLHMSDDWKCIRRTYLTCNSNCTYIYLTKKTFISHVIFTVQGYMYFPFSLSVLEMLTKLFEFS